MRRPSLWPRRGCWRASHRVRRHRLADDTTTTAIRVCLHAWLAERGGVGNFEGDAILARLRQVIERFGESRFTWWESAAAKIDEHGPRMIDRLGFRKTMEHGMGDALAGSLEGRDLQGHEYQCGEQGAAATGCA